MFKMDDLRCEICDIFSPSYSTKSSLNKHILSQHNKSTSYCKQGARNGRNRKNYHCAICKENCFQQEIYWNHLNNTHQIQLQPETLHFQNKEEFISWKMHEEKVNALLYASTLSYQTKNARIELYCCNRSGYQKPIEYKNYVAKDSCKINSICPAQMKVTILDKDSSVTVQFQSQHVGHEIRKHLIEEDQSLQIQKLIRQTHNSAKNHNFHIVIESIIDHSYSKPKITVRDEVTGEQHTVFMVKQSLTSCNCKSQFNKCKICKICSCAAICSCNDDSQMSENFICIHQHAIQIWQRNFPDVWILGGK